MNMTKKLKMIPCLVCTEDMPELRLIKFGYKSCVNCSDVKAYRAVTTVNGTGDNTWNDIQIMTQEQYNSYEKAEKLNSRSIKSFNTEE